MSFSQALAKHPRISPPTYVSLIAASEQGGFMAEVLKQLIVIEESGSRLRGSIVSAFSYPAFLVVFSFAVVMYVLTVVFPKFEVMFFVIADLLPFITEVLMGLSRLLRDYWMILIGGAGVMFFGFRRWLAKPAGAAAFDHLKVTMPFVGEVFRQFYLIQSMRIMALSLSHGVSVLDAIRACRDVVSNRRYRQLMNAMERDVQEGRGVAVAFVNSPLIPPLAKQMVDTGEQSGNLALVMTRIADFYERSLTGRLAIASKLVEPIMLLVMGVMVGLIVASLILPIFQLSKAVH